MKTNQKGDSRKKEKPTLMKVTSATNLFKKESSKKNNSIKKEENAPSLTKNDSKSSTPLLINTPKPSATSHSKTKPTSPNSKGASIGNTKGTSSNSKGSSVNNSKGTCASSTGTRSTKVIQPSLRISPKSSLSEINSTNIKKTSLQNRKIKFEKPNLFTKKPNNSDSDASNTNAQKKVKEEVKKSLANVIKVYHASKKSQLDISLNEQFNTVTSVSSIKFTDSTNGTCQQKLCRSHFNFMTIIGEGGYGKVWKVEHNKTRVILAMKQMSKAMVILKKSVNNVNNQMKILSKIRSNWISNIVCAFNDRDNLYLGMDYLPGGDLRSYLSDSERLKEKDVKFLIACILKGLEYIHSVKVFHRDIKPENLVIDEKGYLRLADFGIARSAKDKHGLDASGTPGYMAPEVICKQDHSYPVDYYAVGIICYELMMGKRPYYGQNRAQIRDNILSKQHSLKKKDIPQGWSNEAAEFINKLIQRQPTCRLGYKNGVKQLMEHPWFAKFPWKQLQQKKLESSFKPYYLVPAITDRTQGYDEAVNQYKLLQRTDNKVDIFSEYSYNFQSPIIILTKKQQKTR